MSNDTNNLKAIGPMVTKNKLGKIVCRHPWTSFDIYPNGDVTPCCYLPQKIVGNVNRQKIEEVWNSEEYMGFRKEMSQKGAQNVCSRCPILTGMKHWETLEWYSSLDKNSEVFKNAQLNELEIFEGKTRLESKIRRLKYIPSFSCNLRCYHCNQEHYRLNGHQKLGKNVFDEVCCP